MYVVTGCPRSGTSLTMDLFRIALGDDRILGDKFPMDKERPEPQTPKAFAGKSGADAYRAYLLAQRTDDSVERSKKRKERLEASRSMNPNGFWEMEWSVQGLRYLPKYADELANSKTDPLKAVKIVSQGLPMSDHSHFSKVVFLARHPAQVAKSQEDLKGKFPGDAPQREGKEVRIHSPVMYANVTCAAAQWFLDHPEIPMHMVNFDDLLADPENTVAALGAFVGEGDWVSAAAAVDQKLNRSLPQGKTGPIWDMVENMHNCSLNCDWQGVLDAASNREALVYEEQGSPIYCSRLQRRVQNAECNLCRTEANTLVNFKATAEKKDIPWHAEPCLREVLNGEKTPEESIEQNHWL